MKRTRSIGGLRTCGGIKDTFLPGNGIGRGKRQAAAVGGKRKTFSQPVQSAVAKVHQIIFVADMFGKPSELFCAALAFRRRGFYAVFQFGVQTHEIKYGIAEIMACI